MKVRKCILEALTAGATFSLTPTDNSLMEKGNGNAGKRAKSEASLRQSGALVQISLCRWALLRSITSHSI